MTLGRPVNFIHFPKVGGKSIRIQLEREIPHELQLYYNNPIYRNILSRKYSQQLHKYRFQTRRVVFGHFSYNDRLHRSIDSFNLVVIREPIDWLGSMHHYWTQKYDSQIGLMQFVKQFKLQNAYEKFLGQAPEKYFELIGFHENFEKFLKEASELLELEIKSQFYNTTQNKSKDYKEVILECEEYPEVLVSMKKNIKIYESLKKSRFNK